MGEITPIRGPQHLGVDVRELWNVMLAGWRLVLIVAVATALVAAAVSLLRPNQYDAQVTLVPNEAHGVAGGLDLGKATGLAQAVGISLPGSDGASIYGTVIESRRVLDSVLDDRFYEPKARAVARLDSLFLAKAKTPAQGRAAALRWLRDAVSTSADGRTGVWSVSVRHPHAETAAGIANALVAEADGYRREQSTAEAAKTRRFIEQRMDSTRVALRAAEEAVKEFRARNVRINKSPELLLTEGRLIRDARVQEEIFLTLTRQYELAKINEAYHQPELVVLDWAEPPAFKSSPMRTRAVLAAGILGGILGVAFVLLRYYFPTLWPARRETKRAA